MSQINSWQSWANVLDTVKTELGSGTTKLELTDNQIIKKLYDHVLPEFSRHSGLHRYYYMTEANIIGEDPVLTYQFKDFPYRIMGILGKIDKMSMSNLALSQMQHFSGGDVTDYLVRQNYLDMSQMVRGDPTYRFKGPDLLEVTNPTMLMNTNEFILEVDAAHNNPSTIDSTLYQEFLDLATAYCLNMFGKMRKKYSNVSTPFGSIEMNADEMINESKEIRQRVLQDLKRTPMDQIIWIL